MLHDVSDNVDAGGFFENRVMDGGLVEDGGVAVFDVEDGGAVEGVGPCYVESVSFALQQFYGGDADVIGALGGAGSKDAFCFSGTDVGG